LKKAFIPYLFKYTGTCLKNSEHVTSIYEKT